ncbi:MAG: hypothetical protein AAFO94_18825, partial [Bacteroidota bacterium]
TSKFGLGFEFFTGFGKYTGELNRHFNYNVPFGVAFDLRYKNWTLFLRDYIGLGRINENVEQNGITWTPESGAESVLAEASIGYTFRSNRKLTLTPFIGISGHEISPRARDRDLRPELDDVRLRFTRTYTTGINLDLKLAQSNIPIASMNKPEEGYWMMRVRYSFNAPEFQRRYGAFSGHMHYITIGFGGIGRRVKRDY